MSKILVVDDELSVCQVLHDVLSPDGHEVDMAKSAEQALEILCDCPYDLIITDFQLGEGMDGLDLLHEVKARFRHTPLIMITAYGTVDLALQAMKAGASDFIIKPFKAKPIRQVVHSALQQYRRLSAHGPAPTDAHETLHFGSLVGESIEMAKVYNLIRRVAQADAPVLLTGESGTGKELVAKAIHQQSARASGTYVPLNCAAIAPNLLESELFGHVSGAFTGAFRTRDGLFVAASGGTLLLDEIGSMPIALQVKLLRALQEQKIRRVGDNRDLCVDVRIIASTNENLEQKCRDGTFREDLYYRICVIPIEVPALRRRTEDIPALALHFCELESRHTDRPDLTLAPEVFPALIAYSWPGNVRELRNVIACAVTLNETGVITVADLPPNIAVYADHPTALSADDIGAPGKSLREYLRVKETEYLAQVLHKTQGNRAKAAGLLGISRATLYRKLPDA